MWRISVGAVILCSIGLTACTEATTSKTAPPPTSLPVPAGWKTVTYHGVGIDVPSDWLVQPWRATCGVEAPTVFIGPAKPFAIACVSNPPAGAEVVLGALPMSGLASVSKDLNGIPAYVVTHDAAYDGKPGVAITDIWVSLRTKNMTISVSVGDSPVIPGGAPGRAQQIVQTIHRVP